MQVPIYLRDTDAVVHQDFQVKIAKMRKLIANLTHVQHVQCVKTNPALEITHAFAEVVTQDLIAM